MKGEFKAFSGRVAGIDCGRQRRRSRIHRGALEIGVVVFENRCAPVEPVLQHRAFQADLVVPDDLLFELDRHVTPADERDEQGVRPAAPRGAGEGADVGADLVTGDRAGHPRIVVARRLDQTVGRGEERVGEIGGTGGKSGRRESVDDLIARGDVFERGAEAGRKLETVGDVVGAIDEDVVSLGRAGLGVFLAIVGTERSTGDRADRQAGVRRAIRIEHGHARAAKEKRGQLTLVGVKRHARRALFVEVAEACETTKAAAGVVADAEFLAELFTEIILGELQDVKPGAIGVESLEGVEIAITGDAGQREGVVEIMRHDRSQADDGAVDAELRAPVQLGGLEGPGVAAARCEGAALECGAGRLVALVVDDEVCGGRRAGLPPEAGADAEGVLTVEIRTVGNIFDRALAVDVGKRDAGKKLVRGEHRVVGAGGFDLAEIAKARGELTQGAVLRFVLDDRNGADLGAASKQSALRALQHLDPFEVEELNHAAAGTADRDAILENGNAGFLAGIAAVGGDTADIDARIVGRLLLDKKAGHVGGEVIERADAEAI